MIKSRKVRTLLKLRDEIAVLQHRIDVKRARFTAVLGTLTGTQLGEWNRESMKEVSDGRSQ